MARFRFDMCPTLKRELALNTSKPTLWSSPSNVVLFLFFRFLPDLLCIKYKWVNSRGVSPPLKKPATFFFPNFSLQNSFRYLFLFSLKKNKNKSYFLFPSVSFRPFFLRFSTCRRGETNRCHCLIFFFFRLFPSMTSHFPHSFFLSPFLFPGVPRPGSCAAAHL